MEESRRRTLYDMEWLARGADMHWRIYKSIEARDSEKARALMTEHLHVTKEHWR
jgi:DNA-binding GntR family transcriptional regulator